MFSNKYFKVFLKRGLVLKRLLYLCLMYKIEYGIGLNENGRPCIELPEEYEQKPEDKFFAIEIARYYMQMVEANMDDSIYDQNTFQSMDVAIRLLGQLGDEMAIITHEGMRAQGEVSILTGSAYQIVVESIEERDALPEKNIIYDDKLFDRVEGLKVRVRQLLDNYEEGMSGTYELQNGITNENWVKI
jgi:hypothetical protein